MFARKLMAMAGALLMTVGAPLYAQDNTLSEQEIEDLRYMREEEKLARDVYAELYQYFKERGTEMIVLAKIAESEQRHMNAMRRLLAKYAIEDPAAGLDPGEFDNSVLSTLYENLVSDSDANATILGEPSSGGKTGPEAALYAGAWIEERDMLDIVEAISNTSRAKIVGVYTNLLCGSRAHLRAFVRRLGADDYQPQLLYSAEEAAGGVKPEETLVFWLGDASDAFCM